MDAFWVWPSIGVVLLIVLLITSKDEGKSASKESVVSKGVSGMKSGIVKWFSKEKGYGFITADDTDYYVHVKDIKGTTLPMNGDTVSFAVTESDKGLKAERVSITKSGSASGGLFGNDIAGNIVKAHFRIWGFKVLIGLIGAVLFGLLLLLSNLGILGPAGPRL